MPDDPLSRAIRASEALQRQIEPLSAQIQLLQSSDWINRLIQDADRTQTLMSATFGPLEDLRRTLRLNPTLPDAAGVLRGLRGWGVEMEKQFFLPTVSDALNLFKRLDLGETTAAVSSYLDYEGQLRTAIEAMTTPWLNRQNQYRSLVGLLGLQHIGAELHSKPAFDVEAAARLRHHLGDWRAKIAYPSEIFQDPLIRSGFYRERGLNPDLTCFPAAAFGQAIQNARVRSVPPPRVRGYGPTEDGRREEEEGFQRTNAAHDCLQRFESQFRAFIDRLMTRVVGKDWIKRRVPGDMRRRWSERRRAEARGRGEEERPLIAYANFTDYESIIVRKDNWNGVFAPLFLRKSSVQESLRRLYPVRNCTMHCRIITHDDELYLHAETTRLLRAIEVKT